MSCEPETVEMWEGSACVLLARIVTTDNEPILQADISSISFASVDRTATPNAVVSGPTALDKAAVIFNTLQTGDSRWKKDSTGYNFLYSPPVAAYPAGDNDYYLNVVVTPAVGQPLVAVFKIHTMETGLDSD